jgi:hypothetical protein
VSRLIPTKEAAETLGTSERRVQQLATELNLEPQKFGRMLFFSTADLKKMQARNTKVGKPKKAK